MLRGLRIVMLLVLLVGVGSLSGCGKKGDLEPPGGQPEKYPRQYPDPSSL
jgi:predicted small lipoprotein YifL